MATIGVSLTFYQKDSSQCNVCFIATLISAPYLSESTTSPLTQTPINMAISRPCSNAALPLVGKRRYSSPEHCRVAVVLVARGRDGGYRHRPPGQRLLRRHRARHRGQAGLPQDGGQQTRPLSTASSSGGPGYKSQQVECRVPQF